MSTPKMDEAQLKRSVAAVEKHGTIAAAAKALGMPRGTLHHHIKVARKRGLVAAQAQATHGRSLSEFRASHDKAFIVPQKIKQALSTLGAAWSYEVEFCKLADLTPVELAPFRDQYAEHIVEVRQDGRRRTVWAGTKDFANKLREMVR